jgi:hypothetical protein
VIKEGETIGLRAQALENIINIFELTFARIE